MSYSHQVKDELAREWPGRTCCRAAELSAIIRMDGRLHLLGSGRQALRLSTENAAVARASLRLLSDLFGLGGEVTVRRSKLNGANNYSVYIGEQPSLIQAFNELGILDDSLSLRQDVPGRLVRKSCCAAAYLRGLFLGGGFVSSPKGKYHLELMTGNKELSGEIVQLMARFELKAGLIEKRGHYTIYLKQAQAIVDFLALIGAHSALLDWEDTRTLKEVRAKVNRLVNCDTANLSRAVRAAQEQLQDIAKIEAGLGVAKLPQALREIARARQANPQANLSELGNACVPKLTKSATYHRVRRLQTVAAKL